MKHSLQLLTFFTLLSLILTGCGTQAPGSTPSADPLPPDTEPAATPAGTEAATETEPATEAATDTETEAATAAETEPATEVATETETEAATAAETEPAATPADVSYTYTAAERIEPFWKNSTMYNECLTMHLREDGQISGKLLFTPTAIVSVRDVTLQKEYTEGVDWKWEAGTNRLVWLEGSSIPYFTEADLSGKAEDGSFLPEMGKGQDKLGRSRYGNCLYTTGAFLYEKQISVTYTYTLEQVKENEILYTEYQGDKLVKTTEKLKNGEALKVLVYGDSIMYGCDASGMYNREPKMPLMSSLIKARLGEATEGTVTLKNIAVSGWSSISGSDAMSGPIPGGDATTDKSKRISGYDLVILSFGMNDGGNSKATYQKNIKTILDKIREKSPDAEFILISCMNPNPRASDICGNQQYHGEWLKEIAENEAYSSFTTVVDFYAIHKSVLAHKDYASTTGNNFNHPNDWLIRLYAQNILATVIE